MNEDIRQALSAAFWPPSIRKFQQRFESRKPFTAVAIVWLVCAVAFAILPVLLVWTSEHPGAAAFCYGMVTFVAPMFAGNVLHCLLVDIFLDYRIEKKRFVGLLLTSLGQSATFSVLTGMALGACYLLFWDRPPIVTGILIWMVWWQWMVDAFNVRFLYGCRLYLAFPVVAISRVVGCTLAIIAFSILTGKAAQWMGRFY